MLGNSMKYIIPFLFISMVMAMHDEDEPLIRNNHPELEYFRLMEKINYVQSKINYLKYHAHDDKVIIQDLEKLQFKLIKLQSKISSHEND